MQAVVVEVFIQEPLALVALVVGALAVVTPMAVMLLFMVVAVAVQDQILLALIQEEMAMLA
jgi:hypothetical protein